MASDGFEIFHCGDFRVRGGAFGSEGLKAGDHVAFATEGRKPPPIPLIVKRTTGPFCLHFALVADGRGVDWLIRRQNIYIFPGAYLIRPHNAEGEVLNSNIEGAYGRHICSLTVPKY